MNVLPVITRELREQARQPFTYSLRVIGVLVMACGAGYFAVEISLARFRGSLPNMGGVLFSVLQFALSGAIWILVPLSAADCISRERREGTLGLLFLTPLKALDIVIAKGLAHGLRAATLWLAVLPVLTIPFLLGGVSWQQAVISSLINLCSICWALAAALLASAISKSRLWAQALAIFLAAVAVAVNGFFTGLLILRPAAAGMQSSLDFILLVGLGLTDALAGPVARNQTGLLLWGIGQAVGVALIVLFGAGWLAAIRMRRNWREEPPSARVQQVEKVFCRPVVGVLLFHWWMRRTLTQNPIGWLEQRTWSGRLVTWVWLGVIVGIYSAVFTQANFFRNSESFQTVMGWLLAGSIAASAAGSFRRERETGVLELLLVSPLTTGQIIGGRLRGLWAQFFPSAVLLLSFWIYLGSLSPKDRDWQSIWHCALMLATVPVIGLYFSLCCKSFLGAFLATLAVGLIFPVILSGLMAAFLGGYLESYITQYFATTQYFVTTDRYAMNFLPLVVRTIALVSVAWLCWLKLHRRLQTRSFPLERTTA